MADQPRKVIFLSPSGPTVKEIRETHTPQGSQSLVRVEYSGVNPADIKHASIGMHSSVSGYDFAVFGQNPAFPGRPISLGAYQDFAIADSDIFQLVLLPRMSMREAAVLPTATLTAADGLFNVLALAFPSAGLQGAEAQSVLIWGGGGAVGVCAIQLAKAAGHGPIVVTASAKHHATLKELGADFYFDYSDTEVVVKVGAAVSGKRLSHVFNPVGAGVFAQGVEFEKSSVALAAKCESGSGDELKFGCLAGARGPEMDHVSRDAGWKISTPTTHATYAKEWPDRSKKAWAWVTANYGKGQFRIPNVRTVHGAEKGMEAMKWSAEGKSSLEKIVIEHPL
ncbi:hypothetical protein DL95DRAFT_445769 [Leptodontidium sp. 2 PMI_412]|nr:hypothetical protein DL95DRAFT_445769 [Leptodontidium sp. 2 PMI_412]